MRAGEGIVNDRDGGRRPACNVRLRNDATSVKVARDEVTAVLRRGGWPAERIEQARVVVSELVTNAMVHAGTAFLLTVRIDDGVVIEVSDGAPASLPRRGDVDYQRPGGMGLNLVEAMSDEWGVQRDRRSKVVWARLGQRGRNPMTFAAS